MKTVDVKPRIYIDFNKKKIRKVLSLKFVIISECQNVKIFLQKAMFETCLKKLLWLKS